MGITIHYKGKIKDLTLIPRLQEEFIDIAKTLKWKYHLWNEDLTKPMDISIQETRKGTEVEGHVPLQGIALQVEKKVETLDFLFNADGHLTSLINQIFDPETQRKKKPTWIHVKTQFGSVHAHIAIVKLLKYLKKRYVPDLEVRDEGEYWEKEDKNRLLEMRGFLFNKINQLSDAISSVGTTEEMSKEDLIVQIELILKKYLDKGGKES